MADEISPLNWNLTEKEKQALNIKLQTSILLLQLLSIFFPLEFKYWEQQERVFAFIKVLFQ